MKLVITGALGHIGSALIRSLSPKPGAYSEVLLVDNLRTQRYCSLFDLPQTIPFRFVEADIMTADLGALFKGADVVVHLAALTDAASSFADPKAVEAVNLDGLERVAVACEQTKAALVFASTTSVYGQATGVVTEESETSPQSPYAESKLRAEQFLAGLPGLRYVIFRFGTIYGTSPGMRFHTAVNKFCWQATMGQPITVWRTALEQGRPYLWLGDACRAINMAIERDWFDRSTLNVLSDNATVGEIVETIRIFEPGLSVELVDSPIMNQLSYVVSGDRAKLRDFVPYGSLHHGIGETMRMLQGANRNPPYRWLPKSPMAIAAEDIDERSKFHGVPRRFLEEAERILDKVGHEYPADGMRFDIENAIAVALRDAWRDAIALSRNGGKECA